MLMEKAVLETLPRRLAFTMISNPFCREKMDTNPIFEAFRFKHFEVYENRKQVLSEDISLKTANARPCTMDYQTLFSRLGIHHVNTGIQITHVQYMIESFMLVIDLTPDGCPSKGQTVTPVSPTTATTLSNSNSTMLFLGSDDSTVTGIQR